MQNNFVDCFLRNNMCKFYHALQTRYNQLFKWVWEIFFQYFWKIQKMKYDAFYSSLFRKIAVLQSKKCTVLSLLIFYRITHASFEIKRPWNNLSWQKQIIWKVWHDVLQYRKSTRASKIQEILYYENFAEYYLCIKQYFDMFFSTPKHIPHAKSEINH